MDQIPPACPLPPFCSQPGGCAGSLPSNTLCCRAQASVEESEALQEQDSGFVCLLFLFPVVTLFCISFLGSSWVGSYSLTGVFGESFFFFFLT